MKLFDNLWCNHALRYTGKHVESDLRYFVSSTGQKLVEKTYRLDVPCIQWLNQTLGVRYDPRQGLPVAQHEFRALKFLQQYGFTPIPIMLKSHSIIMTYGGKALCFKNTISTVSFLEQSRHILNTFNKLGLRHNDLLPRNILVDKGKVRVIDFTLAEFEGISLISHLPDSRWARAGQDEKILDYADLFASFSWLSRFKNRYTF